MSKIDHIVAFLLVVFCVDVLGAQMSHYYSNISPSASPRATGNIACSATCSRTDGCCGYSFTSSVCELILAHDVEATCAGVNKTCYVRTTSPCEQPTTVQPTTVQPTTVQPTTVQPTTVQPTTVQPTTMEPTTVEATTLQV